MSDELNIRQYDERFLECRDMRHAMRVIGAYRVNGHVERMLVCSRGCGVQAVDTLNERGMRLGPRRYRYPDGYQVDGGLEFADVRAERLRRTKLYASRDTMMRALEQTTANQSGRRRRQLKAV